MKYNLKVPIQIDILILFIVYILLVMFTKCASCLKAIGFKVIGHTVPKWYSHLRSYCAARAQKNPWCNMFLDNFDQINEHHLSKQIQYQIRNTNIAPEIVIIITEHYKEEGNVFKFLIELFGSYVKLKYSETINPSRNALNRMANQHQDFTKLLIDIFVLYYGLQDRQIVGEQMFYKLTLPSLAVNLMFQNPDIVNTVTRTSKLALKTQIDKIQFQIQRFSSYSTKEIIVNEKLRLNEGTLTSFSVSVQKCQEVPYSGTIQIIKQVIRVNSPAEKVRLLEGIQKQIQSSVVQFYRKHGIQQTKFIISPEDLSNIFLYILVQANQPAIYAHIQIANLFRPALIKGINIIQSLIESCQNLQRGILRKQSICSTEDLESKVSRNEIISGFFDEVSNFDL